MVGLDRSRLIELLGRLGSNEDAATLEAARELDRMLSGAGASWDDLLRREPFDDPIQAVSPGTPESVSADEGVAARSGAATADVAEIARLIDRLLGRKDLSGTTRESLADMKRAMAEGSLDPMDGSYVRALAKRLGA